MINLVQGAGFFGSLAPLSPLPLEVGRLFEPVFPFSEAPVGLPFDPVGCAAAAAADVRPGFGTDWSASFDAEADGEGSVVAFADHDENFTRRSSYPLC